MNLSKSAIKNQQIRQRVIDIANYIIENNATVRDVAKKFNISKSAAHMDASIRLQKVNPLLYKQVKKVLDYNASIKHIRGGESTRRFHKNKI
jgi:putative DeoR family transcriptional regulator (stage III sporulation protein D)